MIVKKTFNIMLLFLVDLNRYLIDVMDYEDIQGATERIMDVLQTDVEA